METFEAEFLEESVELRTKQKIAILTLCKPIFHF